MTSFVILDKSWKAIWAVRFQKLKSYLYWYNFLVAMIYVFFWVLTTEIGLGGYKEEYKNTTNQTGFIIHSLCGSAFYISGYLQFNRSLRQNYPQFHRTCGIIYLLLSLGLFLSMIIVMCGGALTPDQTAVWTPTIFFYWCYCNYDSVISIYRKDVERHRRMNIRAFTVANCIIYMRPTFYFGLLVLKHEFVPTLVLAFWAVTFWAIALCEVFLWLETYLYAEPVMYLSDGRKFYGSVNTGTSLFTGLVPIIVDECEMLDETSMRIVFHTENEAMTFFFPGQHISLTFLSNNFQPLCREYSPIVTESYAMQGRIQLWIRIHPKGVMSTVLRDYVKSNKKGDFEMQGANPMLPGISVKSLDNPDTKKTSACPLMLSVSSSRLNYFPGKYRGLLLIATGTGLAPLLNLINYICNNRDDKTSITLIYITNGKDKFGVSAIQSINSQGKLTVDVRQSKPRFGVSQIETIVHDKISDGSFGGHHDPFAFQIHVSGAPMFVKTLDYDIRKSPNIPLVHEDQLVSWGFSDR